MNWSSKTMKLITGSEDGVTVVWDGWNKIQHQDDEEESEWL